MKKDFRKIIVDNKEYDWLYKSGMYSHSVQIFNILYEKKNNDTIRKRRIFKEYDVSMITTITPIQVRELIKTEDVISTKKMRELKLSKISKINENKLW